MTLALTSLNEKVSDCKSLVIKRQPTIPNHHKYLNVKEYQEILKRFSSWWHHTLLQITHLIK